MQFLDAIGLAYFWEKIKSWVGKNYLSLKGGTLTGYVYFKGTVGILAKEVDESVEAGLTSTFISTAAKGENGKLKDTFSVEAATGNVLCAELTALKLVKTNGTATQVLMADGSVKELSQANGIPVLDAGGNIPLSQLGNLDTTVAEVVTELPTSNIKRHIYLVKDSDTTNNKYAEYVYTGDISAAYDSTKWEKLGDFRATVDLADYAKKVDAVNLNGIALEKEAIASTPNGLIEKQSIKFSNINDSNSHKISFEDATTNMAGFMSVVDKNKLDGIAPNANNYSLPLAANGTRGGIQLGYSDMDIGSGYNYALVAGEDEKAFVTIPYVTQSHEGIMTSSDKVKLDGIANNANNYSLPTASPTTKGGITLGYSQNDKNYPVALDNSGKAYVNVPWIDTNTTYSLATSTNDGLMSKADKTKIDSIDTTYAKKIELLKDVTVSPTETSDNEEIIELEFDGPDGDPICYANLPVATIGDCGLMHSQDKAKLDDIDDRATADSAITTAEIDALFA